MLFFVIFCSTSIAICTIQLATVTSDIGVNAYNANSSENGKKKKKVPVVFGVFWFPTRDNEAQIFGHAALVYIFIFLKKKKKGWKKF